MGTMASKNPQAARLAASVFALALTLALGLANASDAPGAPPPQQAPPAIPPFGANDAGGFRNVLPPGEAGTDNAVQFAQFNAVNTRPTGPISSPSTTT